MAGAGRAPCASPAHGEGAPNMALDAQGKQEMEELHRVAQQFGLTPTKYQPNAVAILRGCVARQAQATAGTMTTPPAPPPEAAPPAPEALPHNPSATVDNVDISTSPTEKSPPKRKRSPAEEEQPGKRTRRKRSRAADWTTLHSADTKKEARTWMHKNTTTNMVWEYSSSNGTVSKCAEHADCSFRCKISKAQVRVPVPKVRCPVNSCYDTFANPVGFLFALACKVTYNRGMSPPVFAAHFFVECVLAKTPTGKVHVERACALR